MLSQLRPVAPSAIAITSDEARTPEGKKPYVIPRALRDDELPGIVAGFKQAAENAKTAGFDGIEIHGANQHTGPYGGSIENRARLMLEVLEAVSSVWGCEFRRLTATTV